MIKKEIMEKTKAEYARWVANTQGDQEIREELLKLKENQDELMDSFYTNLKFGTSGLRGIIGPGTNRINSYVIKRASQGLANYLKNNYGGRLSVVIAYDTRLKSKEFAEQTAKVFKGNGIDVYIFPEIAPVSVLSYGIRRLNATMGIMITASHNPKMFNGYKVYNKYGYQITGEEPNKILEEINKLDYFQDVSESSAGIHFVSDDIVMEFKDKVISFFESNKECGYLNDLNIIYTPLNGTGMQYVSDVFDSTGLNNFRIVESEKEPDENFSTCPVPNPEKITAYNEGFKALDKVNGDLIIATDPDCDRIGAALYHDDMKLLLTGNQLGVLILDFLCQTKKPRKGQLVFKSIVTTPLIDKIAEDYGLEVTTSLTGFKYIGESITNLEKNGKLDKFYFAMEESNGYLFDPFIRDKDGVSGAVITAQMAALYKSQGKTLVDRLHEIYAKYGNCIDKTRNYFFEGPMGEETMSKIMNAFRYEINSNIGDFNIVSKIDYMEQDLLPKENVIGFLLDNGTYFIIRPSGTESKIKVYLFESNNSAQVEKSIKVVIDEASHL